jgi:hypothetical protein
MRAVRWIESGEPYQILPMPMLPDGGPSGIATSIMHHAGDLTILGRVSGPGGGSVPVQWRLMDDTWEPYPMSTELELPLIHLTPLAMADEPWPGPIVGFGVSAQDQSEGVMWEPHYTGGTLHNLNICMDGEETTLTEAVAMTADWSLAVTMVYLDDPDGPTFPAIIELLGELNPCPGDFDGDGQVGVPDLLYLLSCWGEPCGDVDGDGDTDVGDLLLLLAAWGECP